MKFKMINFAIKNNLAIKFGYTDKDGVRSDRFVIPKELQFGLKIGGGFHIRALDLDRMEPRTFRVEAMSNLLVTDRVDSQGFRDFCLFEKLKQERAERKARQHAENYRMNVDEKSFLLSPVPSRVSLVSSYITEMRALKESVNNLVKALETR